MLVRYDHSLKKNYRMNFFGNFVADGTDTIAVGPPDSGDGSYRLHGYKWFTSATDAQMAFTLARLQHEDGMITKVNSFNFSHVMSS